MSELPRGWTAACLRELGVEAQPGFASGNHHRHAGGVVHLRPMNISRDGCLVLNDIKYVDDVSARRVVAGDVLFNNTNSPPLVGKTAYVSVPEPLAFSNHMTRLRVEGNVLDPRFLAGQLHSLWSQGYFQRTCSNHVNQASVATRRLLETVVAVPPLDEQRRIVAILEDHLSRLDAGSAALEAAARRARRLDVAMIDEYFRESRDKHVRISELLAEPMRNGHSASASLTGQGIRTLTLTAVTKNEFSDRYTKLTKADERRVGDLWLTAGDVLVERANTPELVGTSALFAGPDHWAIFPDLLIRIRVRPDRARPQFVAAALRSTRVRRFFRSRARGLAGSMPKIDQATVGAAVLPLPSLAAQDEFLNGLSQFDAAGTRLGWATDLAATRAAALRRSLLTAAFSGRLTG